MRPEWEKEEEYRWIATEDEPAAADEPPRAKNALLARLRAVFDSKAWQWGVVGGLNVFALLYCFEVIPSIYPIYPINGFELAARCLYSALIAFSQRKNRNYPIIWWEVAYLFPNTTLVYLLLIPHDEERSFIGHLRLDFGFAVVCLLVWLVPKLT